MSTSLMRCVLARRAAVAATTLVAAASVFAAGASQAFASDADSGANTVTATVTATGPKKAAQVTIAVSAPTPLTLSSSAWTLPSSVFALNTADTSLLTGTTSIPVGTLTIQPAGSPPITTPLDLTGTTSNIQLVATFPGGYAITGTVDSSNQTITWSIPPTVPPTTTLNMTLSGGSQGLLESTCTGPGSITGTLTGVDGSTYAINQPITVTGCPAPPTTLKITANGLPGGKPSLITVITAPGTAFKAFTLSLPKGLTFKGTKGVRASGAKIARSSCTLTTLTVTLQRTTKLATLKLSSKSLAETAALKKAISTGKTSSLKFAGTVGGKPFVVTVKKG